MVDGAINKWIKIVSGVPQGSMLGPLQFILYNSEMFELLENRLYAYADDSALLVPIRRAAERPAVSVLNRDWARIQYSCGTTGASYKILTKQRL